MSNLDYDYDRQPVTRGDLRREFELLDSRNRLRRAETFFYGVVFGTLGVVCFLFILSAMIKHLVQ